MVEIEYRQLTPLDYDQYKEVRLNCLKHYPGNFGTTYEEESNSSRFKLEHAILQADNSNFACGAFAAGGKLLGICGFVGETRLKTRHRGEIVQMFVDPQHKREGIGKTLLNQVIEKAFSSGQIEQIILSVVSDNEHAVGLYKKAGFTEYGRLENYFKLGTDYSTQLFFVLNKF